MKRFISFILALAMVLAGMGFGELTNVDAATGVVTFTESAGYEEGAYAEWAHVSDAVSYKAYVSADGNTYTQLDDELIRHYSDCVRVDAVGLAAGNYFLKVEALGESGVIANGVTNTLTVTNYDRTGFAFSSESKYKTASGAYNDDGTLRDGAKVIYVTSENAGTVTATVNGATKTGLANIIYAKRDGKDTTPLCVRIIGCVTSDNLGTNTLRIEGQKDYTELGITLEGIGEDATFHGITTSLKRAANVEIRNLGILWFYDDGVAVDTNNCNIWIHDLDITYGQPGTDGDQKKGDGSIDIKKSQYCTVAYNHFFDSGKCSLLDASAMTEGYVNNITMHHNWFDHSDSRHPRIRNGNAFHIYNNYYDGVGKYGVGVTTGSSAFVEANYFRNCNYPMIVAMQGTDMIDGTSSLSSENGGTIKAFGNYMVTPTSYLPYSASNTVEFDAYEVAARNEQVPSTVLTKYGTNSYSNFDTMMDIGVEASDVDAVADVPGIVMSKAGRLNGGDFKWDFDDATEDTNHSVIAALKTAVMNYKTSLVAVGGKVPNTTGGAGTGETVTYILNPSELEIKTYTESFEQNGFTVLASSELTVSIDESSKKIEGVSYPNRLKLGGAGSNTARSIKFTTTAPATFSMYAMASSSSATRTVGVGTYDEDAGKFVDVTTFTIPGSSLELYTVELPTAGTYYVHSLASGLNVQLAKLETTVTSGGGSGEVPTQPTDPVEAFVSRMYTVALKRTEIDADGLANWGAQLKAGVLDGAGIAQFFVLGEEFKMKGFSNEEFVDILYLTFFDRAADADGKEYWVYVLEQGFSREFVLSNFVNLNEFKMICDSFGIERGLMLENGTAVNPGIPQFVKRLYLIALDRAADNDGLKNYTMALLVKAETAESVAKNFLLSAEYELRGRTDEEFVTDLYSVFMNREADADGIKFWVDTMAIGMTKAEVIAEFAKSAEFKVIAAGYGLE